MSCPARTSSRRWLRIFPPGEPNTRSWPDPMMPAFQQYRLPEPVQIHGLFQSCWFAPYYPNFFIKINICRGSDLFLEWVSNPTVWWFSAIKCLKLPPYKREGANLFFFEGFVNGKNDSWNTFMPLIMSNFRGRQRSHPSSELAFIWRITRSEGKPKTHSQAIETWN